MAGGRTELSVWLCECEWRERNSAPKREAIASVRGFNSIY